MSLVVSQASHGGRAGELALWGVAGMVVLAAHLGAAVFLMRATPDDMDDGGPPAAIMIELAPEPEAAKTEEEQISPDQQDSEKVESQEVKPVEEPVEQAKPEPMPEPMPEQVMPEPVEPPPPQVAEVPPEPTPPEPMVEEPPPEMPEPEPQMTQTIPEPPPEPIEPPKPIEEQPTVALDNVEVPLPTMRPMPPVVEKPPEKPKKPTPKKQPVKKVEKPRQQQAAKDMAEAKVQTRQSDRTAATQTSSGFFSQTMTPTQWQARVQAKIARNAGSRCPVNDRITASVRVRYDANGNISGVSLSSSSGNPKLDEHALTAARRASPLPPPPSGTGGTITQPVGCR